MLDFRAEGCTVASEILTTRFLCSVQVGMGDEKEAGLEKA